MPQLLPIKFTCRDCDRESASIKKWVAEEKLCLDCRTKKYGAWWKGRKR